MRILGWVILVVLFSACPTHAGEYGRPPGQFDYYLLTLSWHPEFCHMARNVGKAECRESEAGFVVHGLWPQFLQGYPEYCSHAPGPRSPNAYLDIMPSTALVMHEWKAHGTCSGLNAEHYFQTIRRAYKTIHIPAFFDTMQKGSMLSPSRIKQVFTEANPGLESHQMTVSCGKNMLTAVAFCLDNVTLKPRSCGNVRDCHATTIRVTPIR